LALWI